MDINIKDDRLSAEDFANGPYAEFFELGKYRKEPHPNDIILWLLALWGTVIGVTLITAGFLWLTR